MTANGKDLDAPASPVFGRAPVYVFVDSETMDFEAAENPAIGATGGAGIQAAQFVVERGAEAVITGNVGPNAFDVLQAAGVSAFLFEGGTVREAVEALREGRLAAAGGATGPQHAGIGSGRGMGRRAGMSASPAAPPPTSLAPSREAEIAELRRTAADLRRRLAEVIDRVDRLEKEG